MFNSVIIRLILLFVNGKEKITKIFLLYINLNLLSTKNFGYLYEWTELTQLCIILNGKINVEFLRMNNR